MQQERVQRGPWQVWEMDEWVWIIMIVRVFRQFRVESDNWPHGVSFNNLLINLGTYLTFLHNRLYKLQNCLIVNSFSFFFFFFFKTSAMTVIMMILKRWFWSWCVGEKCFATAYAIFTMDGFQQVSRICLHLSVVLSCQSCWRVVNWSMRGYFGPSCSILPGRGFVELRHYSV